MSTNDDLFIQMKASAAKLPPRELPHKNTAEELLQMVLCEGQSAEFTEPMQFNTTKIRGFVTPIAGQAFEGTITHVSLTVEEWQRLGEYLFAKTGDTLPGSPLKHDPEAYCRRIINNHYKQEN